MTCARCGCGVYEAENQITLNKIWHKCCFCCRNCNTKLDKCTAKVFQGDIYCASCYENIVGDLEKLCPPYCRPCRVVSSPSCVCLKKEDRSNIPPFDYCKKYNICFPPEENKAKKPKTSQSCSCIIDTKKTNQSYCFAFPIPREVANYYNRANMRKNKSQYSKAPNCCSNDDSFGTPRRAACIRVRNISPPQQKKRPSPARYRSPSPKSRRCCCCSRCRPPACPAHGVPSYPAHGAPSYPPNGAPSHPSGGASSYPAYGAPSYPTYDAPSYPTNGAPSYPTNGAPSYPTNGAPSYPTNGASSYPTNGAPSYPTNSAPSYPTNGAPSYPTPSANGPPCCRCCAPTKPRYRSPLRRRASPPRRYPSRPRPSKPPPRPQCVCGRDTCNCCGVDKAGKYCVCGRPNPCHCKMGQIRAVCTSTCVRCGHKVYAAEKISVSSGPYHNSCFSCFCCHKLLDVKNVYENCDEIYCKSCYNNFFGISYYGYGSSQYC